MLKHKSVTRPMRFGYQSELGQKWFAQGLNAQSRGHRALAESCFAKADRFERQFQLQASRHDRAA